MGSFFSRLEERARQVDSLLCVGLDPHPADASTPEAMLAFCARLIESTSDLAAAFKPNIAFFEAFGPYGLKTLIEVIALVPEGIPVILDAKRGDIASTAQAYVRSVFEQYGAHAVTVNPYLGYDSISPFLELPERGVFLLCKTSNPGAADIQELRLSSVGDELSVFEHVAGLARRWNVNNNLGLVVGATHPQALGRVRAQTPKLWILAPGVGFQGGDLAQALKAGLRVDGLGLLVPVSRGISRAADPRRAATELRDAINIERQEFLSTPTSNMKPGLDIPEPFRSQPDLAVLADALLAFGCIKFAEPDQPFILKSGLPSPVYIDLRQLVSDPALLAQVTRAYLPLISALQFDRLAALPYAALPIGTAISLQSGLPLVYPRKEVKSYGTKAEIEGSYQPGERVVVIDDLTTTGGSKFEAIEKLTSAGLQVTDVVVLIDRQSGAAKALAEAGFQLHPVFTLTQLLDYWEWKEAVSRAQIEAVREFLAKN